MYIGRWIKGVMLSIMHRDKNVSLAFERSSKNTFLKCIHSIGRRRSVITIGLTGDSGLVRSGLFGII
jgi:hypothetical protein